MYNKINQTNYIVLKGDFNARVSKVPIKNLIGDQGKVILNGNGHKLREFVTFNTLKITNTFLKEKDIVKIVTLLIGFEQWK